MILLLIVTLSKIAIELLDTPLTAAAGVSARCRRGPAGEA
jgi:hypothetical protein